MQFFTPILVLLGVLSFAVAAPMPAGMYLEIVSGIFQKRILTVKLLDADDLIGSSWSRLASSEEAVTAAAVEADS
jgi:hypothetical protein